MAADEKWSRYALCSIADGRDIERVAAFNASIHGKAIGILTKALLKYYPGIEGADFAFVEDTANGEIASALCLLPWTLRYEGCPVAVAEMGMVGTAPEYRNQGLVRAQVEYYNRRMHARGCVLSAIQGIPYYYRQFGYTYALPLEGGLRLSGQELPAQEESGVGFRPATVGDIPQLQGMYEEAARSLPLHAERDAVAWEYLLVHAKGTESWMETWLASDAAGAPVGYLRLPDQHFGAEQPISEASALSYGAAVAALHFVRRLAEERGKPGVRLNLPEAHPLMWLARAFGAHELGRYAWQWAMPDSAAFLRAVAPTLEQRVARSPFAGLSETVTIGFYRSAVELHFAGGRLERVAEAATPEAPIQLPHDTFIPLALGAAGIDELHAAHPDVNIWGKGRLLMETIFPKQPSYLYSAY